MGVDAGEPVRGARVGPTTGKASDWGQHVAGRTRAMVTTGPPLPPAVHASVLGMVCVRPCILLSAPRSGQGNLNQLGCYLKLLHGQGAAPRAFRPLRRRAAPQVGDAAAAAACGALTCASIRLPFMHTRVHANAGMCAHAVVPYCHGMHGYTTQGMHPAPQRPCRRSYSRPPRPMTKGFLAAVKNSGGRMPLPMSISRSRTVNLLMGSLMTWLSARHQRRARWA